MWGDVLSVAELGEMASNAAEAALDSCIPKLDAEAAPLELWVYAFAMRVYWMATGIPDADVQFHDFWSDLSERAIAAHKKRFGEFVASEEEEAEEVFAEDIIELYDSAVDVADALIKGGASALHKALAAASVLPDDWSGTDHTLATLASMFIVERAMKDVPPAQ